MGIENQNQNQRVPLKPSMSDSSFQIELHRVPIVWDLQRGSFTFFGIDSALFWTDPSLVRAFVPLAEEIGIDLFRLLVAHSSSLGTKEDYETMISTLGSTFAEGFLAWGRAVSTAGWGWFEMPEFEADAHTATVIIHNPWEMSMQRNLSREKQWGCPFLQGKIIGIFNNAFAVTCWADETCHHDDRNPRVVFRIYPADKTISLELEKLRNKRRAASERVLADEVRRKTHELESTRQELEGYSKSLEQKVRERTAELESLLKTLEGEKEKLKVLAETDPMTGLYNRRAFNRLSTKLLERYLPSGQSITVIMLDIDHFKRINDSYGHDAGDRVLIELAAVLDKTFRRTDLRARLGGEEFAVVCANADFTADPRPLENLRRQVERHTVVFAEHEIRFTISIGAVTTNSSYDLDTLLRRADKLLYRAKQRGRNRFFIEYLPANA